MRIVQMFGLELNGTSCESRLRLTSSGEEVGTVYRVREIHGRPRMFKKRSDIEKTNEKVIVNGFVDNLKSFYSKHSCFTLSEFR